MHLPKESLNMNNIFIWHDPGQFLNGRELISTFFEWKYSKKGSKTLKKSKLKSFCATQKRKNDDFRSTTCNIQVSVLGYAIKAVPITSILGKIVVLTSIFGKAVKLKPETGFSFSSCNKKWKTMGEIGVISACVEESHQLLSPVTCVFLLIHSSSWRVFLQLRVPHGKKNSKTTFLKGKNNLHFGFDIRRCLYPVQCAY